MTTARSHSRLSHEDHSAPEDSALFLRAAGVAYGMRPSRNGFEWTSGGGAEARKVDWGRLRLSGAIVVESQKDLGLAQQFQQSNALENSRKTKDEGWGGRKGTS